MTELTIATCRFCEISQGSHESSVDWPWLSDSSYFAIASIGALVEGWSLICPVKHALNLKEQYRCKHFWHFVNRAVELVRDTYGPVVLFEHGAVCENSATSCGTAHAHLHVVPFSTSLADLVSDSDPDLDWTECNAGEVAEIAGEQEYLFVLREGASPQARGRLAKLATGQSQFFRKVIADSLGRLSEFSYKTHPQDETSRRTAVVLTERAKENGNTRIADAA